MTILRLPKGLGIARRFDNAVEALPPRLRQVFEPAHYWMRRQASFLRMKQEVGDAADDIRFAARVHRGPKIFVDCGMNEGRVMERFMRELPGFDFHGFELNPDFRGAAERLKRKHPNLLSTNFVAVSDKDGETQFALRGKADTLNPFDGSTIVGDKITGKSDGVFVTVPTIDFSRWLKQTVAENTSELGRPFVAVKMDIEGAEYDVLEHMLKPLPGPGGRPQNPAAIDVDVLVVEFHAAHMTKETQPEYYRREAEILSGLDDNGVLVHRWV